MKPTSPYIRLARMTLLVIAALFALSSLTLFLIVFDPQWTEAKVEDSTQHGRAIALALDQYFEENGAYPQSLEELELSQNLEIENPTVGERQWYYLQELDGNGYYLAAYGKNEDLDPRLFRTHDDDQWYLDTQ